MGIIYNETLFWILFLVFNFIQFAYNYFIQTKSNRFFPFSLEGLKFGRRGVFISKNADFFRICVDLSIVILLYRLQILESGTQVFTVSYCLIFLFNIYHYSFRYIYKTTPIIANDIKLLRDGVAILYNESKFKVFGYASGIIIILTILYITFHQFIKFANEIPVTSSSLAIAGLLVFVSVVSIIRKGVYKSTQDTSYRFMFQLARFIGHYLNYRKLTKHKNKIKEAVTYYKSTGIQSKLNSKPNIYMIFVESYGSILIRDDRLKKKFKPFINSFTECLQAKNWCIKSNLSSSVSLIGPSWLAYSSFLHGCRIDSHILYENLLRDPHFYKKDSILNFLKYNGYTIFNLNPTKENKNLQVPMDDLTNFYHVDNWILRKDIHYNGSEYGFGEYPPDQYTMNYAYEYFLKKCSGPYMLFYLTKNSHSPYISPVNIVRNWKDLNQNHEKTKGNEFLKRPNIDNFYESTCYEISVIQDYILQNGNENDIFLLIGDHQPHHISDKEEHGLETIVHIISKNKDFVEGFEQYGFRNALFDDIHPIKLEGLHSAVFRELIRHYSNVNGKLPEYEPNGLPVY